MKTQKSFENGTNLAVVARGNGFYYAIRRFVDDVIEARRRHNTARHTAQELARLPDLLKQDIGWPSTTKHEDR